MSHPLRDSLGFVLAIDGCARSCGHCPAFGLGLRPEMAPMTALRDRLRRIKAAMPGVDFADKFRTIHSWRIGDMADYHYTEAGVDYDMASVADAWLTELGQPLYVVTNGTLGSKRRRATLETLAANPELVSQVKLTVTPFDPRFELSRYVENMAYDVETLWPLGELPGRRFEGGAEHPRFRINVKAAPWQQDRVVETLRLILLTAGFSVNGVDRLVAGGDPRLQIKPVYDLRVSDEQPLPEGALVLGENVSSRLKPETARTQRQLGFRPNGDAFEVDLWAFREANLRNDDGQLSFGDWF